MVLHGLDWALLFLDQDCDLNCGEISINPIENLAPILK